MGNDVKIIWDVDAMQGDISFDAVLQDLEKDDGLETAVLISLFTDRRAKDDDILPDANNPDKRGWWAGLTTDGDQIGSRLWLLDRAKTTTDVLTFARQYAEESLQWLIEDEVASKIAVTTERQGTPENGVLALKVEIYQKDGNSRALQYNAQWIGQFN